MERAAGRDLHFTRDEYAHRLERLRAAMRERGCEAAIIDDPGSLAYLAGFGISGTRYQACLVPLDTDPVMVLRSLDEETFLDHAWFSERVLLADDEDPSAAIAATLRRLGLAQGRVGFELDSGFLTVQRYESLCAALDGAVPCDLSGVVNELRLRKSAQEIAYCRRAAEIADETMARAVAAAGPGVSERGPAALAARSYLELGASDAHVGPVASGSRTGSVHGTLGDHVLERGDILHVELIPEFRGYSARLMRSIAIGDATPSQRRAAEQVVEAQDAQIAAMRPGARACDVDRECRSRVLAAGLRDRFDNVTGYTLGYYGLPSAVRLSDFTRCFLPTADWTLEPEMVFHVYVWGGGVSISESVLVTERGPERLTRTERTLFVRG